MKHPIGLTLILCLALSDLAAGVVIKKKDGGILDCASVFGATPDGLVMSTTGKSDSQVLGWDTLDLEKLALEQPEINAAYLKAISDKTPQRLYLGKAVEFVRFNELPARLKDLFATARAAKKSADPQVALRALRGLRDARNDEAKSRELERYQLKTGYGIIPLLAQMEVLVGHLPSTKILQRSTEEQAIVSKVAKFIVTMRLVLVVHSITTNEQASIGDFLKLIELE